MGGDGAGGGGMGVKVTIDRISEGIAVLVPRQGQRVQIFWPESLLPKGAREGHVLDLTLQVDEEATARARAEVSGLIEELTRRSGPPPGRPPGSKDRGDGRR